MENQTNFFDDTIELDHAFGIGTFPNYGISQPVSETLSQDMSDFDPVDPNFKFTEEIIPSPFTVLTKRQLEYALSQGSYDPTKCAFKDDLTTFFLNDAVNEIMDPTVAKVPKLSEQVATQFLKQRKGLSEQARRDLEMSNKKTEKTYTGYVQDLYDYIENEENGKGSPTDEVTLCNFFPF